jgi:hypothetical protein
MAREIIYMVFPDVIKAETSIHDNLDDKLIYPEIKIVQDTIIMPMMGSTLFKKILSLIQLETISNVGNEKYKLLLDDYLTDAICNFVLAELSTSLNNQFYNKGVSTLKDENSSQPSYSQLAQVRDKYKQQGEFYITQCRKYLVQNMANYVEFSQPASGFDVTLPELNTYTCPLFLGDEMDVNLSNGYSDNRGTRNTNYNRNEQQY